MGGKGSGGPRAGTGPQIRDRVNKKLAEAGWNWMYSTSKYIRVGSDIAESRYWIAPYAGVDQSGGDDPVNAKYSRSFRSLKEIEEFLNER